MADLETEAAEFRRDAAIVQALIESWMAYRRGEDLPGRLKTLKHDLLVVRNVDQPNGYPPNLTGRTSQINAAVEHYFLCRHWVANGIYPAWQARQFVAIYDEAKLRGLIPRSNPKKPVTPLTRLQRSFQEKGIRDGSTDAAQYRSGTMMPGLPPVGWIPDSVFKALSSQIPAKP